MSSSDSILFETLKKLEGSKQQGYVPKKDGKVIQDSGVTIGMGFDLGKHSTNDLFRLGLPPETLVKLVPYMEKTKDEAVAALKAKPLRITPEEEQVINEKLYNDKKQLAKSLFEKNVGFSFDSLPDHVQDALIIQNYQQQAGLYWKKDKKTGGKVPTDFVKQMAEGAMTGDFTAAADNLATWSPKAEIGVQARYKAAADVLRGDLPVHKMDESRFGYAGGLKAGTVKPKDTPAKLTARSNEDIKNYLGDERAQAVIDDMALARELETPKAVDGWDAIGDAIRSVRSTLGMDNDPKPIRTYEVREGDTLSAIAKRLGTTVGQLVEDNNIADPNKIKAGQPLEF